MTNSRRIIFVFVFASTMFWGSRCLAQLPSQAKVEIVTDTVADLSSKTPTHLSSWIKVDKSNLNLIKEPVYQSPNPQYGKLTVGNSTTKKEIAVVVDETDGKSPRIYVDLNNNRDLTDDGSPDWPPDKEEILFKTVIINGTLLINGRDTEVKLPYGLLRFTDAVRKQAGVFYACEFGRSGKVKVGDKEFNVLATTADNQGLYSNPKNVILIIDRNNDGKFDSSKDSEETFVQGDLFFLGNGVFRFLGASETGDKMTLESLPLKIPDKWKAVVGDKIADFGFKTLDGKDLKLSDFKGKVVLLDFWATWCGPCFKDLPDVKKLYREFDRSKFEIIGISVDGAATHTSLESVKKYVSKNEIAWPITFNEQWNELLAIIYKVEGIPYQVIIDKDGIVRMIEDGADRSGEKLRSYESLITKLIAK